VRKGHAARRASLIRIVITTPSGGHSKAIEPRNWPVTLLASSLLPKPSGAVGAAVGGPPSSFHTITMDPSLALQVRSMMPSSTESAPYLIELVASSWTIKARVVTAVLSDADLRDGDVDTVTNRYSVVWREQDREQVAQERRLILDLTGNVTDEVVRPAQGVQTLGQVAGHFGRRRRRARGDRCQGGGD